MLWLVSCTILLVIAPAKAVEDGRLPNDTVPLHYDLLLDVTGLGRNDFTYRGRVSIRILIVNDTDQVVLHNVGSSIGRTSLRRVRDREHVPHRIIRTDAKWDLVYIRTDRMLLSTDDRVVVLTIDFNNTLDEERRGFYHTYYRGPNRVKMPVATSHLQPCHARRAFPCFDEPSLKATFQVTIVSNSSLMVASNTPIERIIPLSGGYQEVLFERTLPMQTYLVSFLVANYSSVHAVSPSRVRVGVLAPPKDENSLQFSLKVATELLTVLEQYTEKGLGLGKLDHVAIPLFGNAMENWGLVAYDNIFLVHSDRTINNQLRTQAVLTIGHETAHQLFGNLVGPQWWSYVWLSEGFATFLEMALGSEAYPELLPLEETFIIRHVRPALLADEDEGAHALTVEPVSAHPAEIALLFDTITYSKAGCVLRMINCTIGEQSFKDGVRRYLMQHRNEVVKPEDLYHSFRWSEPAAPTVEEMFRSWADKPGYPLVTVERLNASFVRLRQQRHQHVASVPDDRSRWYIPITYFTNSSHGKFEYRPAFWMKESDQELVVPLEMSPNDVLIVNPRQIGFYRVDYGKPGWKRIVRAVASLPPIMQAKVIDDAFTLARSGHADYNVCIDLLDGVLQRPDPLPWLVAMAESNIGFMQRQLRFKMFDDFVLLFVGKMLGSPGNVTQSLVQLMARDKAYEWWTRLGGKNNSVERRRRTSSASHSGCSQPTVDDVVTGLSSPNFAVREHLLVRLKCHPNSQNERVLQALRHAKETHLLTPAQQYLLLGNLLKSDPGRFLGMVVQFLADAKTDELPPEPETIRGLDRLLRIMVREVTDLSQVQAIRKLMLEKSTILPEGFFDRANAVMTSTISWRRENEAKLRHLLSGPRFAGKGTVGS